MVALALLRPPAPWGLPGRCRGRPPHELLFHIFVLDPSLLVLPGPGPDVRLHSWAGGPLAPPRLPPTSPGAAGRGLPAARPLALGLVDPVHGAVSQLTHQLAGEGGAGISPAHRTPPKLADLAPAPRPPAPAIQRPVTAPHTFSSSGSHESRVRDRTLEQWTPRLLDGKAGGEGVRARLGPRAPPGRPVVPPVDARALDAEQHAQVDAGPARVRLPTVAALAVPSHVLHALQHTLALDAAFPRVRGRVDAACGRGRRAVQPLETGGGVAQPSGSSSPSLPSGAPPPPQTQVPAQAKAPEARACARMCARTLTCAYTQCTHVLACGLRELCMRVQGAGGPTSL